MISRCPLDTGMTSREICLFVCLLFFFVHHCAQLWNCLRDYVLLSKRWPPSPVKWAATVYKSEKWRKRDNMSFLTTWKCLYWQKNYRTIAIVCCAIEKPFGRKCRQVKDENFVFVSPFGKCLNWPNSLAVKRYEASLSLFLFRTLSDKTNRFYVFYAVHLFTKRLPKTLMCHHFVPVPLIDVICNLLCTYHWTDARQHRIYLLKRPRHPTFLTGLDPKICLFGCEQ